MKITIKKLFFVTFIGLAVSANLSAETITADITYKNNDCANPQYKRVSSGKVRHKSSLGVWQPWKDVTVSQYTVNIFDDRSAVKFETSNKYEYKFVSNFSCNKDYSNIRSGQWLKNNLHNGIVKLN